MSDSNYTITVNYLNVRHSWYPSPTLYLSVVPDEGEVGVTIDSVTYPSVADIPEDVLRGTKMTADTESSPEK